MSGCPVSYLFYKRSFLFADRNALLSEALPRAIFLSRWPLFMYLLVAELSSRQRALSPPPLFEPGFHLSSLFSLMLRLRSVRHRRQATSCPHPSWLSSHEQMIILFRFKASSRVRISPPAWRLPPLLNRLSRVRDPCSLFFYSLSRGRPAHPSSQISSPPLEKSACPP